jgi:hypothetical protein
MLPVLSSGCFCQEALNSAVRHGTSLGIDTARAD